MSDQELLDEIAAHPVPAKSIDLKIVQQKAVELRDLQLQKTDLEAQVKEIGEKIQHIERHELIDLFDNAGLSSITVDADGNHPAFDATRSTVYGGKIPDERRVEALNWFEAAGHGDLVKSVITIQFGLQEDDARMRVMKLLSEHGVEYYTNESVHHMTLKAFLKNELKAGRVIHMDISGSY